MSTLVFPSPRKGRGRMTKKNTAKRELKTRLLDKISVRLRDNDFDINKAWKNVSWFLLSSNFSLSSSFFVGEFFFHFSSNFHWIQFKNTHFFRIAFARKKTIYFMDFLFSLNISFSLSFLLFSIWIGNLNDKTFPFALTSLSFVSRFKIDSTFARYLFYIDTETTFVLRLSYMDCLWFHMSYIMLKGRACKHISIVC